MYGKMQESGFTEIIPYLCILTIWVSTLFSSILNPLRVHMELWLQLLMAWWQQQLLLTKIALLCPWIQEAKRWSYFRVGVWCILSFWQVFWTLYSPSQQVKRSDSTQAEKWISHMSLALLAIPTPFLFSFPFTLSYYSMCQQLVPFCCWIVIHCVDMPYFINAFIIWWTVEYFLIFGLLWIKLLSIQFNLVI